MTSFSVILTVLIGEPNGLLESDLVVRCWTLDPKRYSMRGYGYPDRKRVSIELPKMKQWGLIEQIGEFFNGVSRPYRLTVKGIEAAELQRKKVA